MAERIRIIRAIFFAQICVIMLADAVNCARLGHSDWWFPALLALGAAAIIPRSPEAAVRLMTDQIPIWTDLARLDAGADPEAFARELGLDAPADILKKRNAMMKNASVEARDPAAGTDGPQKTLEGLCGACGHVWTVSYLPMPLASVARLCRNASCPKCGGTNISVALSPQQPSSGDQS